MEKPEPITWHQLKEFVNSIPDEYLKKNVSLLSEDNSYSKELNEPFFIERDVYYNKEDNEDCGTLDELKELHAEEFTESNYILSTKIGTPFLWIA